MENNKIFTYGILKRGHVLDLRDHGAKFLGEARIQGATLYGIGRRAQRYIDRTDNKREFSGVGLRLTSDDSVAHGELWEVPDELWQWLDHIEGNGFNYERKIVVVDRLLLPEECPEGQVGLEMCRAWVYEHMFKGFTEVDKIEGGKF